MSDATEDIDETLSPEAAARAVEVREKMAGFIADLDSHTDEGERLDFAITFMGLFLEAIIDKIEIEGNKQS